MLEKLYFYKAKIVAVSYGDTCASDIDLGLSTFIINNKIRLAQINVQKFMILQNSKD